MGVRGRLCGRECWGWWATVAQVRGEALLSFSGTQQAPYGLLRHRLFGRALLVDSPPPHTLGSPPMATSDAAPPSQPADPAPADAATASAGDVAAAQQATLSLGGLCAAVMRLGEARRVPCVSCPLGMRVPS
jgi:hypothetical protein